MEIKIKEVNEVAEIEKTSALSILTFPYKCDVCSASFSRQAYLESHSFVHEGCVVYECEVCDAVFKTAIGLKRHNIYHSDQKKYGCTYCNKSFVMKSLLAAHELVHTGEKPFKCDICGQSFRRNSNLYDHRNVIHLRLRPYKCRMCDYKHYTKRGLLRHSFHHLNVKAFKCEECGVGFTTYTGLNIHRRVRCKNKERRRLKKAAKEERKRCLREEREKMQSMLKQRQNLTDETKEPFKWDAKSKKLLINLVNHYEAYRPFPKKKKREIWEAIAGNMGQNGYRLTWEAASKHWSYFLDMFKKVTERLNTKKGASTSWPYYETIAVMLANVNATRPPNRLILVPTISRDDESESLVPNSRSNSPFSDTCAAESISYVPFPNSDHEYVMANNVSCHQNKPQEDRLSTSDAPIWFIEHCKRRERRDTAWHTEVRFLMSKGTNLVSIWTNEINKLIQK